MTSLTLILSFKITVTLLFVVFPFLFHKRQKLDLATSMTSSSASLYRLFGVSNLALLVAYAGGIYLVENGVFPWVVIFMGLMSNFGSTLTLILSKAWAQNLPLTVFFGVIAALLLFSAMFPQLAMMRMM